MSKPRKYTVPRYPNLMNPILRALKENGGSCTIGEIHDKVLEQLKLPKVTVEELHNNSNQSELDYQLAWARTYLRKYGAIDSSSRGVWSIVQGYPETAEVDPREVVRTVRGNNVDNTASATDNSISDDSAGEGASAIDGDDNVFNWKERLSEILKNMDAFAFERLSQRLLRECGFTDVKVTKRSGDGGIDGTGKLLINGIFSFSVAFQCKRYTGTVGAPQIRDFRGSLDSNIEKGVLITTGVFSQEAKREACAPGKKQIDLMDGDTFMNKLAEYQIGLRERIIKDYDISLKFFEEI